MKELAARRTAFRCKKRSCGCVTKALTSSALTAASARTGFCVRWRRSHRSPGVPFSAFPNAGIARLRRRALHVCGDAAVLRRKRAALRRSRRAHHRRLLRHDAGAYRRCREGAARLRAGCAGHAALCAKPLCA